MSDLLDIQVELYPELLRRMAAGEQLPSTADDTEKTAATLLAVEAIENERAAEQPAPAQEKQAIVELGLGAALGAALKDPLTRLMQHLQGKPAVPEAAGELIKSFRNILEERARTESARRSAVLAGLGGAAAGALAVKALEKKESAAAPAPAAEKSAETPEAEKVDVTASNIDETNADAGTVGARALLDRILKNFR